MASQLTEILTRLKAMHDDLSVTISNSRTLSKHRLPPASMPSAGLPLLYAVEQGFENQGAGSGYDLRTYRFNVEVVISPWSQVRTSSALVAESVADAETIGEAMEAYYDNHRMCSTNALGTLNYIFEPGLGYSSTGWSIFQPVTSNDQYVGIIYELTIPMVIQYTPDV